MRMLIAAACVRMGAECVVCVCSFTFGIVESLRIRGAEAVDALRHRLYGLTHSLFKTSIVNDDTRARLREGYSALSAIMKEVCPLTFVSRANARLSRGQIVTYAPTAAAAAQVALGVAEHERVPSILPEQHCAPM
jgi:hypothetical protein